MTGKPKRDRTHKAIPEDAYMTIDPRVIPSLLKHTKPRGRIWEPAAGTGEMVWSLRESGYLVFGTDLISRGQIALALVSDFFSFSAPPHGTETIITNPPNSLNLQFATHALKLMEPARGIVALYQRHEWDTTQKTAPIFDHPAFAMKIVPRFRPRWIEAKSGEKQASPFHRWSWYVWNWKHQGPPILRFA